MRYLVCALAGLLFASSCASSSQPGPQTPADHLTVRSPGSFDEVTLQGDRIFSPEVEVMRYGDEYRGKAYRKDIDLRVKAGLIEGMVGSGRTELHVQKFPDGFEMKGLYAGKMGNLTVRQNRLEGKLGGRAFQLAGSTEPQAPANAPKTAAPTEPAAPAPGGGGAEGASVTKSASGWTEFAIPASLASLSVEHQAAVVAIFVGR